MSSFSYHNPVKIVFGEGSIASLPGLLPAGGKTLVPYGGGSIRKNGVYDQVKVALSRTTSSDCARMESSELTAYRQGAQVIPVTSGSWL